VTTSAAHSRPPATPSLSRPKQIRASGADIMPTFFHLSFLLLYALYQAHLRWSMRHDPVGDLFLCIRAAMPCVFSNLLRLMADHHDSRVSYPMLYPRPSLWTDARGVETSPLCSPATVLCASDTFSPLHPACSQVASTHGNMHGERAGLCVERWVT
jgi:hypothetical protein